MNRAAMIIAEAEARGVVFTVGDGFTLQYDAPRGALSPELRRLLVEHKPDVMQLLFEREERAALQNAPEWQDAGLWERGTTHPAALALLDKFAPLGLSFVSVRPMRQRQSEAA
jgi:hypothetical protein